MSTALAIIPRTVDEVSSLSSRFHKSTLIPAKLRQNESDVFVTILAGQELGLSPMASLRGVNVIEGRPTLAADTMVALVLGSGKAEYFRCVEGTDKKATYETKRIGGTPEQVTWTIEDATRAGLTGKDNWKKYPRAMLKARCRAELARDVYPDVLAGCYEHSEADEIVPYRDSGIIEAESVDVIDVKDGSLDEALVAIRETETVDDLRNLSARFAEEFKNASASVQEQIAAAWKERKAKIEEPA